MCLDTSVLRKIQFMLSPRQTLAWSKIFGGGSNPNFSRWGGGREGECVGGKMYTGIIESE